MRLLAAGALAILALSLGAASTRASCAGVSTPADAIADGQFAFVGTVESVRNTDRWAMFEVEEIWSPQDLPRFVEVRGSIHEDSFFGIFSTVSSNDRYFEAGATYLVFPRSEGGLLFDDACSATEAWSEALAAHRPATAHPPGEASTPAANLAWPTLAAGIAALAVIGGGLALVWRHRSVSRVG